MAIREFTITLFNETPFVLRKQKENLATGNWGEAPPQSIDPGATVQWRSESPGWFRGTEGSVDYLIDDNDSLLGEDSHPGRNGCFQIWWLNPYQNLTEKIGTHRSFKPCDDLLETGNPENDYSLQLNYSSIDSPEMMGWKEAVVGNPLAALAGVGKVMVWYRLRPKVKVILNGNLANSSASLGLASDSPLPDPEPLRLIPIQGGPAAAWKSKWADVSLGLSSLEVAISSLDSSSFTVDLQEKPSFLSQQQENLHITQERLNPYRGDIWSDPGSGIVIDATIDKVSLIPDLDEISVNVPSTDLEDIKRILSTVTNVDLTAHPISVFIYPLVDTITLGNNIWLQLYGDYNPSRQIVRYRVRYLRTGSDGKTETDVMLVNYEPIR